MVGGNESDWSIFFWFVHPAHKNCSTLNKLVAKLTVGISQGNNCQANIFIGCYLEFKLNLTNMQSRIQIWLNVKVNNLTITISEIFGHKIKILP